MAAHARVGLGVAGAHLQVRGGEARHLLVALGQDVVVGGEVDREVAAGGGGGGSGVGPRWVALIARACSGARCTAGAGRSPAEHGGGGGGPAHAAPAEPPAAAPAHPLWKLSTGISKKGFLPGGISPFCGVEVEGRGVRPGGVRGPTVGRHGWGWASSQWCSAVSYAVFARGTAYPVKVPGPRQHGHQVGAAPQDLIVHPATRGQGWGVGGASDGWLWQAELACCEMPGCGHDGTRLTIMHGRQTTLAASRHLLQRQRVTVEGSSGAGALAAGPPSRDAAAPVGGAALLGRRQAQQGDNIRRAVLHPECVWGSWGLQRNALTSRRGA